MSEADTPDDESNGISVKREQTLVQKESLTITSERGTGTRDEDKVRLFREREAELDVDDDVDLPNLISDEEQTDAVEDVARVMAQVRAVQPDEE